MQKIVLNMNEHQTRFPNTPISVVWSGSPFSHGTVSAWFVYFGNGRLNYFDRNGGQYVRLVRGGQ